MIRTALVFFIIALCGLIIEATLIHSLMPSAVAPDVIVVLVVALALLYRTVPALFGAFLLGLLADYATGEYLGPNAAGCVVAFMLSLLIADKMYGQKAAAQFIVTLLASVAKTLTFITVITTYVNVSILSKEIIPAILVEAFLTACLAPLVIRFLIHPGKSAKGSKRASDSAYSWSAQRQ